MCRYYLKRLRIPILDLFDGWHIIEPIRQISQLLDPMGEPYWELFGQELRSAEKCSCFTTESANPLRLNCCTGIVEHTCRWLLAKLDHLPQAHSSSWETRVVLDGVHQPLRLLPRHRVGYWWPSGLRMVFESPSPYKCAPCHELQCRVEALVSLVEHSRRGRN